MKQLWINRARSVDAYQAPRGVTRGLRVRSIQERANYYFEVPNCIAVRVGDICI